MSVEFLEIAQCEYCDAFDYYETTQPGLEMDFRDEIGRALSRIVEFPHAWSKLSRRTRRCLVNRFPYGVLYQTRGERILIVGVMHLRRNPVHWRART